MNEGAADQTSKEQKAITFDDLFGGLFQTGEPAPEARLLSEADIGVPSAIGLTEYEPSGDEAWVSLEKLPAFHSLVSTASVKGFISQQEIVTRLPERYVERFIRYAIDHDIVILETDPLAELAKEEIPPFKVEVEEEELDLFRLYQYDARKFPLLSPEEEVLLAKKIEQAEIARWRLANDNCDSETQAKLEEQVREGEKARIRFIEGNLRLVIYWARKYQDRGLELMDVIQEGNLGLMKAIDRFDYRRGCRFRTYASWWIKQAITRGIAEQSRLIRLPVHMYETVQRFESVSKRLTEELGRNPTLDEMALEMDLLTEEDRLAIEKAKAANQQLTPPLEQKWHRAVKKAASIAIIAQEPLSLDMRISQEPMSLEMPVGSEEESLLDDFIEDETITAPLDAASRRLLREQLESILNQLSKREREVLEMRFGLKDGRYHTLEEVGKAFGLTRERIRQIELRALERLRHPRRSRKLRDFL